MKFEKVKCLVRVMQAGNANTLVVSKAGVDAVPVAEIPILRAMNDIPDGGDEECCISTASVAGSFESTVSNELSRLREKYGPAKVDAIYPGGRGLPKTLEDCELPDSAMDTRKPKMPKKE